MTNKTSELDEYFGPVSADEPELSNGNDQPEDDFETANDTEDLEMYNRLLAVFTSRLLAVASTWTPDEKAQRALVEAAIHGTIDRVFEKDGDHVEKYEQKVRELIAKKKASAHPQPAQPTTAAAPVKSEPTQKPAIAPVGLPEAPFSATVKLLADGTVESWLITVRGNSVEEGTDLMAQLMKMVRAKVEMKPAKRSDAPSTANRRIGPNEPASAPKQGGNTAPVRSFDPDEGNKKPGEVLHEKVCQIEKVMAQDGKVQINLYPVLPNGEARYPVFYLKSDADKEEVWKHVDVDKLDLAKRYNFPATVDYVLSEKLNQKGKPYKNLRAIRPE